MTTIRKKLSALLVIFCLGLVCVNCQTLRSLAGRGGTVFTVEIETDEPNRQEIIKRAVRIIEEKLSSTGTKGEVSPVSGKDNQISVKIYGADKLETLKKFLFSSYRLELKKVVSPMSPMPLQTYPSEAAARQIATKYQEILSYPEADGKNSASPQFVIVEKNAVITGEDVSDAEANSISDANNVYSVYFSLNPEGAKKLSRWTASNLHNYIAVVLNREVKSVAYIKSQISDSGEITGRFSREEAENIALSLKSGYLPATMKIIEEKTFKN